MKSKQFIQVPTRQSVKLININSIEQWEGVLPNMQDNVNNESGYAFYFNSGNITWWLKTVNGSVNFEANAPNASISTGTWNHIAGTYDGSALRLYVNGIYVDSYATTGNIDWTNSPSGFYTPNSSRKTPIVLPSRHFRFCRKKCRLRLALKPLEQVSFLLPQATSKVLTHPHP